VSFSFFLAAWRSIAVTEYNEGKNHPGRTLESDSISSHKINYARF
jgi:hypothetical protein